MNLAFLLEQNECVSHFFFPLLFSATSAASSPKTSPVSCMRIPDTILFTYSKPTAWFYFDPALGGVRRRPKRALVSAAILEGLVLSGSGPSGLRAWYVCPADAQPSANDRPAAPARPRNLQQQQVEQQQQHRRLRVPEVPVTIVTQARTGRDGLLRFLQQPKGKGMLQRLVDSAPESDGTQRNTLCVCTYSCVSFAVECLVSRHRLDDVAIPLEQRLDLQSHAYDRRPVVTPALAKRFFATCENAAKCVTFASGAHVAFLSLCCRVDAHGELYVLWCNTLKLHNVSVHRGVLIHVTHQGSRSTPYGSHGAAERAGATGVVMAASTSALGRTTNAALEAPEACRICSRVEQRGLLLRVQLKWLLYSLALLDRNIVGWSGDEVPPSVALLCPELTPAAFAQAKASDFWTREFAHVCEGCLDRCNAANDALCRTKQRMPAWLQIDQTRGHPPAAAAAGTGFSAARQRRVAGPALPVGLLRAPESHAGEVKHVGSASHSSTIANGVGGGGGTDRCGPKELQERRCEPRFVAAQRSHPAAAPLYAADRHGVLHPVGFGRPPTPPASVAKVPVSFAARAVVCGESADRGAHDLALPLPVLAELAELSDDARLERIRWLRSPGSSVTSVGVAADDMLAGCVPPPHTPRELLSGTSFCHTRPEQQ